MDRLIVDTWNGEWGVWDTKREKFLGEMFVYRETAEMFLHKLKRFMHDYED